MLQDSFVVVRCPSFVVQRSQCVVIVVVVVFVVVVVVVVVVCVVVDGFQDELRDCGFQITHNTQHN